MPSGPWTHEVLALLLLLLLNPLPPTGIDSDWAPPLAAQLQAKLDEARKRLLECKPIPARANMLAGKVKQLGEKVARAEKSRDEAKLAVDQNDDSEDARALRRKRRVAKPIQAFDHERRRHNAQLAAQRLATLSEEEFIGARLYTGVVSIK